MVRGYRKLEKAIDIAKNMRNPIMKRRLALRWQKFFMQKGEYSEAETHLTKSLNLIGGGIDKWLESNALRILATVHRGQGRLEGR